MTHEFHDNNKTRNMDFNKTIVLCVVIFLGDIVEIIAKNGKDL